MILEYLDGRLERLLDEEKSKLGDEGLLCSVKELTVFENF